MDAANNPLSPTAPTQSPSYAEQGPSSVNLPLSMDPVLAVVTNSTGQQVRAGDTYSAYGANYLGYIFPIESVTLFSFMR